MTFVTGGLVYPVRPDVAVERSAPTGTSQDVDWSRGDVQTLDLTTASGNVDVTFSSPRDGATYQLIVVRDGAGNDIASWPANVRWPNLTAPILQSSNNGAVYDLIQFVYDGTLDLYHGRDLSGPEAFVALDAIGVNQLQDNAVSTSKLQSNAVTNTVLRDSSALSVMGRSSNSSGDPADIAASAGSGAVLRESGSSLAFGTVATAGIANDAVDDTKLRNSSALSVIGRSANSTGDPADIAASAASGAVLRESGSSLSFGTVATAGIANDAVDNTKLRNSSALSVIGRSANSTGDPADIAASAASGAVLRESGSSLSFGTVATAGIADDAVTDAKLRNAGACSVIGRSANSSGDPADISAAANQRVLARAGDALSFQQVTDAMLVDARATSVKGRAANTDGVQSDIQASTLGHILRRDSTPALSFGTLLAGAFATGPGIVTPAMLDNGTARTVLGRSANSSGARADIAGSGSATAPQVLTDDGTTVSFVGVDALGSSYPLYSLDFTSLANNTLTGTESLDGRNWTVSNEGNSTKFEIVNGTGLHWDASTANTVYSSATQTASRIQIGWAQLLGSLYDPTGEYLIAIRLGTCTFVTGNRLCLHMITNGTAATNNTGATRSKATGVANVTHYGPAASETAVVNTTPDVLAIRVSSTRVDSYYGTWASGWPARNDLSVIGQGGIAVGNASLASYLSNGGETAALVLAFATGEASGTADIVVRQLAVWRVR